MRRASFLGQHSVMDRSFCSRLFEVAGFCDILTVEKRDVDGNHLPRMVISVFRINSYSVSSLIFYSSSFSHESSATMDHLLRCLCGRCSGECQICRLPCGKWYIQVFLSVESKISIPWRGIMVFIMIKEMFSHLI